MTSTVIRDIEPLEPEFVPDEFLGRDEQQNRLRSVLSPQSVPSNLHLYGPRGTGKTHLVRHVVDDLPDETFVSFVSCTNQDTQYKVLKQLCYNATGNPIGEGYHTSDLQRLFEKRTNLLRTVVVLDEVNFLLLNDGDDLLYYLSRVRSDDSLSIVTISNNTRDLGSEIGERTYSTLNPEVIDFEPYSAERMFQIFKGRARRSLESKSLQRTALTSIATSTENAAYGLQWLKAAAHNAEKRVTNEIVQRARSSADENYATHLLHDFSAHHTLLYDAVVDATGGGQRIVNSGTIYERYRKLARSSDSKPLSERRVSDFLKHLELLNLIESEYHYGGDHGKTREVRLSDENG